MDETPGIEPVTATAPGKVTRTLSQTWADVVMVHWRADPGAVAPLLPAGTRVDTLNGSTFVSLVCLVARRSRLGGVVPAAPPFGEVNVRLYAVDGSGRRGTVFVTMEASSSVPVLTARPLLGLPYRRARIAVGRGPTAVRYETVRRTPRGDTGIRLRARIGPPRPADPTVSFLTARWRLFTARGHRSLSLDVAHPPWSLCTVDGLDVSGTLLQDVGVEPYGPPLHPTWSPRCPVRFGVPEPLTAA
ncbi:MAG TPA: DUF2071 domain-containing protein [Streptosporangiales bacterium]